MLAGMILEENKRNVSMLAILGYTDREIRTFIFPRQLYSGATWISSGRSAWVCDGLLDDPVSHAVIGKTDEPACEGFYDRDQFWLCAAFLSAGNVASFQKESTVKALVAEG